MLVVCNLMEKDLENIPNLKLTLQNAGCEFTLALRLQGDFDFKPDFDCILTQGENIGNPQGLNLQIRENEAHLKDGIAIIAPDIEMPINWLLKANQASEAISDTGLVGFKWRPVEGRVEVLNGIEIEQTGKIFGCIFISPRAFQKCGFFLEVSKYGLWDNEYHMRTQRAGFRNYYLKGYESKHKPSSRDNEVRKFKDTEMNKAYHLVNKYADIIYHNPYK